jgi:hypothetical protein
MGDAAATGGVLGDGVQAGQGRGRVGIGGGWGAETAVRLEGGGAPRVR